jgi:hypothetical protein
MNNIKSIHWKYEEEWRYIATGRNMSFPRFKDDEEYVNNRKFEYKKEAIEEIILGVRFIHGINKYNCNDTLILANTPDLPNGKEKIELLNFIVENNIQTLRMTPKIGSKTFEVEAKQVTINKIDKHSFQMKI